MRRARDPVLLAATALTLLVGVLVTVESAAWVGRPFEGFLILQNRVVASAGLTHWPAVRDGGQLFQHEVVAVDGQPLRDVSELHRRTAETAVGTPVRYSLRGPDGSFERVVEVRRFRGADWGLLFGSFLFCGFGLTGVALAVWYLRREDPAARGSAVALWVVGMWALSAADLYGPYRLFRIHAFLECLLFAATLQLAMVFPEPRGPLARRPGALLLPYLVGFGLAVVSQAGLHDPSTYVWTHRAATTAFGASMAVLVASQAWAYLRPTSFEARQRVKTLALGTAAALIPQVLLVFHSALSGGRTPENLMGWSGIFFPLSIGYALMRNDLLQVDILLRRSLTWFLLTLLVALGYGSTIAGLEAAFSDATGARWASVVILSCVTVGVLLPLRDVLQDTVDRLFFRASYDSQLLIEETSKRLASVTDLGSILGDMRQLVDDALQPESLEFRVRRSDAACLDSADLQAGISSEDAERLLRGRGPVIELPSGHLGVRFAVEGRLVAVLLLGRRRSGAFYGGDDRRLLQTLANQGAVAVENALALEEVQELNRSLERRVDDRTAELARALQELREAQRHVVHQEKMASLGQLVAGVAHEINNPLNFIQGSIFHLREYTGQLTGALEDHEARAGGDPEALRELAALREKHDLDYLMKDLESLFAACDEGVERATRIVRDLRSFSRMDAGVAQEIDLVEALEATLNLLRGRLVGIEVVREYGELPPVECLEGQLSQVFMNLVSNAADALGSRGRIVVRAALLGGDRVRIEVEDDGPGIAAELRDRVFEPFFTTKDVGSGTGLGLAISYGIVSRHGGELRLESEEGEGALFRVDLPLRQRRTRDESGIKAPASGADTHPI